MRRKDGISGTAKAKSTQSRCGNPPIPGGTTCRIHGAAAPQVKAAAARRILEELVGPALTQLTDLLVDPDTPPAVRLAAVRDILDRTGYKPATRVEVLTIGIVEAEIARLEAELAESVGEEQA